MKEDLQRLFIGEEEFSEITGVTCDDIKYQNDQYQSQLDVEIANAKTELKKRENSNILTELPTLFFNVLFGILFLIISLQIILWLIDLIFKTELLSMKIIFTNFPLYYSVIPLGIWMGIDISKSSRRDEINKSRSEVMRLESSKNKLESLQRLRNLFLECENYNKIIKSIHVKDQIADVLENKKDETIQELLQGLQKIKNNLIKALKLERIMRENADVVGVNRESLEITFAELEYSNMTDNASEYSEFVDDILELGMNLNKEFEEFKL